MVSITYDSKKSTIDEVLKSIAHTGCNNAVFFDLMKCITNYTDAVSHTCSIYLKAIYK